MVNVLDTVGIESHYDDVVEKTYNVGQKWMKCENYSKASELFAKAITVSRSYPLEELESLRLACGLSKRCSHDENKAYHPVYTRLLDSRIACLMKLRKFDKALKESKYFCKVDPMSTRALMRLGKSYELCDASDKALGVYLKAMQLFHDLKRNGCLINSSHEEIVKSKCSELSARSNSNKIQEHQRTKLKRTISMASIKDTEQPRTLSLKMLQRVIRDPVNLFPPEIISNIFSYLEPYDVRRCLAVNKMWYLKLINTPMLINKINLSKTTISKVKSLVIFNNSKSCIKKTLDVFTFSVMSPLDEEKCLRNICMELDLSARKIVIQISSLDLMKAMKYLTSSKTLLLSVEELSLLAPCFVNKISTIDDKLVSMCTQLKKLEMLIIPKRSSSAEPTTAPIESDSAIPKKLDTIKIIFQGCNGFESSSLGFFFKLRSNPLLLVKKLVLVNSNFAILKNTKWLHNFPSLQYLWLERNKQLSLMEFIIGLKNEHIFKTLKFLTFRENPIERFRSADQNLPSEEELRTIMLNLMTLEHLDIMNSSISNVVLHQVLSDSTDIKTLNLGNITEQYDETHDRTIFETDYLDLIPNLQYLAELNLPNMKTTTNTFRKLSLTLPTLKHLKYLDLSFNPSMQGFQLYDILNELTKEKVFLQFLCVDSCIQLSPMTIKDIESRGMVKNLACSFNRTQWEKFGQNSFWIH